MIRHKVVLASFLACMTSCVLGDKVDTNYLVGAGIWDVTGPAAEINMMGYAKASQKTSGIHLRLFSRAFAIADKNDRKNSVVFVSVDAAMVSTIVRTRVIQRVADAYGGVYNESNILISGIHTHSGPGGFHQYVLFDVTSLGFVEQSMDALVEGIFSSIMQAISNLKPSNLYVASGELVGANINRSPTAYLNNPKEERDKYKYNTDTQMTIVKITDENNYDVGMISWFPVHCTSMNNTNGYISGDNKGYASHMMERALNPGKLPHEVTFVAAFAQANEGDVSPNTRGPHCLDTGKSCDNPHSTCNGRNEMCVASGPGRDMFESTQIIGTKQFDAAISLYKTANITGKKLSGPIDFRHQHVDMSKYSFTLPSGQKVNTCPPAMGYSFAAGTTDGPGDFDFTQGTNSTNKFWNFISHFLSKPSAEQVKCQAPKPILLNTGEMSLPYDWQPKIIPLQLLKVGQLVITGLPGEFSTMSGRRVRDSLTQVFSEKDADVEVVLAGLSNVYSDYITTYEEYQVQRYEGASTIFGPHTLSAYIDLFTKMAMALSQGKAVEPGPNPPDLYSKQLSFVLPVVYDSVPFGERFGKPIQDAQPGYYQGALVTVVFHSADPRNDLMTMKSFLAVEKLNSTSQWETVYVDSNWETKFQWVRTESVLGRSEAVISWQISADEVPGTYRIRHSGYYKPLLSKPQPFTGTSRSFNVVEKDRKPQKPFYLQ